MNRRSAPEAAALPLGHRRPKGRVFLTIAAAVVVVGAGTGTSLALSSSIAGGASTPAGAVSDLFTALGNSDVIGMLVETSRVLSADADLADLTGLSAQYQGFTISTDQLAPGVAAVTVTGGTTTGSVDPSQLPLASYFKDFSGWPSTASRIRRLPRHRPPWCWAPKRSGVAGT